MFIGDALGRATGLIYEILKVLRYNLVSLWMPLVRYPRFLLVTPAMLAEPAVPQGNLWGFIGVKVLLGHVVGALNQVLHILACSARNGGAAAPSRVVGKL